VSLGGVSKDTKELITIVTQRHIEAKSPTKRFDDTESSSPKSLRKKFIMIVYIIIKIRLLPQIT
jgi:hypothetical protein